MYKVRQTAKTIRKRIKGRWKLAFYFLSATQDAKESWKTEDGFAKAPKTMLRT